MSKQKDEMKRIRDILEEMHYEMQIGEIDKTALGDAVDAQVWLNRIVFKLNHANGFGKQEEQEHE